MADIDDRWYRIVRDSKNGQLRKEKTARHGKGRRWVARWRDEASKQRHRSFEKKSDAEEWLAKVTVDLQSGSYVAPTAGRRVFREYAESWRKAQVHRATTVAQVETHLRLHVYPTFGDRRLSSIRPSEIQTWVRKLEAQLAPSTIEVVYSFMRAILRAAVLDRLIATSPCVNIKLPKRDSKGLEPLSTNEVEALIAAMPERYRATVVLAAATGLRQGEVFGLELSHVDFVQRTVRVTQQLLLMPAEPPFLSPPKTPASYRVVPLPEFAIKVLKVHLEKFPVVPVEILDKTKKPVLGQRVATLLFTNAERLPIRRTRFSDRWRTAARSVGLADDATFHDLRHYYASLLIRYNQSVKVVQKRLGHKSAVETLDTYSHLWPDSEDQTREAVDQVLGVSATG